MAEEIKVQRKKRGLSLIQPTSVPTLGNYLGAMRGWVDFQEDFDTIFGIADLHSITVRQDPKRLREQTVQLYALLMSVGLDPDKGILFVQPSLFSRMCRSTHSSAGCLTAIRSLVSLAE